MYTVASVWWLNIAVMPGCLFQKETLNIKDALINPLADYRLADYWRGQLSDLLIINNLL